MTFVKTKTNQIAQPEQKPYERPVFETLDTLKRQSNNSVLMRPTLNSRGRFVNRSVCGSPKSLETTLQSKDTYKKDYNDLKQLLIKT